MTEIQKLQKFLSTHIPITTWDYEGHKEVVADGHSLYDAQKDWNQTLCTKINQISAQIFKDTLTGGANVILIPDNLNELFSTLEYLTHDKPSVLHGVKDGRTQIYEEVNCRFGILAGRFQVYSIPNLTQMSLEMYDSNNELKKVIYEENKFFVCKLNDKTKIFDTKNYLKVGVVKVTQIVEVKLFE
jgi:hypothetical protein